MAIEIRTITDPRDPAILAFGQLQENTFAEPELLIPPQYLPGMLARQTAVRRNCMVVAEEERTGQVVGGAIFHYFPGPNTGFSSYMAVDQNHRGRGLARRIHEARFTVLDSQAGERAPVLGLFIDVVAPERLSVADLTREEAVGADPVARRRIFERLGFRKVDVAYYQPPDGPGEEPITTMDLLFCPRDPAATDSVLTEAVAATMHAYWTPWLGRQAADAHAAELRRRCGGERVALVRP